MYKNIQDQLETALKERIKSNNWVYGNGIIETESEKKYFLKSGNSSRTYLCEANGLEELRKPNAIPVSKVIFVNQNCILTEYIHNTVPPKNFFEDFGRALAKLHLYKGKNLGFYEDNFIGTNPQLNIPKQNEKNDWAVFYFNKRLLFQYKLAESKGYISEKTRKNFSKLESRLESILSGSEELPSLLHGDLWSGNYLCNENGVATLIDPAVYYGHRETDLAMSKIFGGFPASFYQAYQEKYPLKEGWEYRENIYKLYHLLNHLNLFGRAYLTEAETIIKNYVK